MAYSDRKRELFERVIRLRRAERAHPDDEDITLVRVAIEGELGRTVPQNLAASLLGVTRPTIARWVKSGDLGTVPTPDGHEQVPLDAVCELYEQVTADGRRGHPLEPAMLRGRDRASRLDPTWLVSDVDPTSDNHERAARRSLAYHRAVARGLRRETAAAARRRVWQWRAQGAIASVYADRWDRLLRQPLPEIRRAISADTTEGRDLRQNSPFAGVLSEPERRKIFDAVR